MQAVGDSRHPLYYLIFSSLLNVALDMVFVGGFGMGVEGAGSCHYHFPVYECIFVPVPSDEKKPGGVYGFP